MKLIILAACVVVLTAFCDADTADGPDIRGCMCPRNYSPVCASDGETYDNQCLFECAQKVYRSLRVVRAGTCDNFMENNNPELGNPAI